MSAKLLHTVYFTLIEDTLDNIDRLVDDCYTYLEPHDGVVSFSAGPRIVDCDRPVNDTTFHVALQVLFADRAAHDAYQVGEKHLEFIARNKESWEAVRVFDSSVERG